MIGATCHRGRCSTHLNQEREGQEEAGDKVEPSGYDPTM